MSDLEQAARAKIIAARLDELALAVANGDRGEFTMRVPAQPDRDADLVLSEAAKLLRALERDARRYRWLRDSAKEKFFNPRSAASEILPDMRTHWELPVLMCSGPIGGHISIDAAIDAAIAQETKNADA